MFFHKRLVQHDFHLTWFFSFHKNHVRRSLAVLHITYPNMWLHYFSIFKSLFSLTSIPEFGRFMPIIKNLHLHNRRTFEDTVTKSQYQIDVNTNFDKDFYILHILKPIRTTNLLEYYNKVYTLVLHCKI